MCLFRGLLTPGIPEDLPGSIVLFHQGRASCNLLFLPMERRDELKDLNNSTRTDDIHTYTEHRVSGFGARSCHKSKDVGCHCRLGSTPNLHRKLLSLKRHIPSGQGKHLFERAR